MGTYSLLWIIQDNDSVQEGIIKEGNLEFKVELLPTNSAPYFSAPLTDAKVK